MQNPAVTDTFPGDEDRGQPVVSGAHPAQDAGRSWSQQGSNSLSRSFVLKGIFLVLPVDRRQEAAYS